LKQKILAVDDQIHMLKLLERIVEELTDYDITATNNPVEALELLGENQYDLVVTDMKMPGVDGMEILKFLTDNQRFEQAIIITAFGSMETATEALDLGAFDYITKPFKKDQIIFAIDRAMRLQRSRKIRTTFERILEMEPYSAAESESKTRYIEHLFNKYGRDPAAAAERTGLTFNEIELILRSHKNDENI